MGPKSGRILHLPLCNAQSNGMCIPMILSLAKQDFVAKNPYNTLLECGSVAVEHIIDT